MRLIFILLLLITFVSCTKLISPGQDAYVLITVSNTTTVTELKELIYFYLDIQNSCSSCNPPVVNLPCLIFFGQSKEDFTNSENITADIQTLINSTYFTDNLFNQSLAFDHFLDINWQLRFVATGIHITQEDPLGRMKKKQIAILSNYFYPDMVEDLQSVIVEGMNTTFVSLFTLNGSYIPMDYVKNSKIPIRVFNKSRPKFNYTQASELYLSQYVGTSINNNSITKMINYRIRL